MTTKKRRLVFLGVIVALAVIVFALAMTASRPKLSQDDRVRLLQLEAMDLEIFERTLEIRENGKELFGWSWTYDGLKDFKENNVTFRGTDGYHEIEYENLLIQWQDIDYMKILFNGSKVYMAKMKFNTFFGTGSNDLKEVTAFIGGPWLTVFDEMYAQAIKGPPSRETEDLKENWGIG